MDFTKLARPPIVNSHSHCEKLNSSEVISAATLISPASPALEIHCEQFVEEIVVHNHKLLRLISPQNDQGSDLIPRVYEGGYKVWECTKDALDYLSESETLHVKDMKCLDLGCGNGILGVMLLGLGASEVVFQDFNRNVIENFTIPNAYINGQLQKSKFVSGDWRDHHMSSKLNGPFDLIVSSETIYSEDSYPALLNILTSCSHKGTQILIAAKRFYFGVGGGTLLFNNLLLESGKFKIKERTSIEDGLSNTRELLLYEFM